MSNIITCTICKDEMGRSDTVSSTNCGHVFHKACVTDWLKRSQTCPQCRFQSPKLSGLFLTFDEDSETSNSIETDMAVQIIAQQLEDIVIDSSIITDQLQASKLNEDQLKELLEISRTQLKDLKLCNANLQAQLYEAELNIKHLLERIDQL